jgi:hypothetical protein
MAKPLDDQYEDDRYKYCLPDEEDNSGLLVGTYGWVCPVCGGGNSPHSMRCPCVQIPSGEVTYNERDTNGR